MASGWSPLGGNAFSARVKPLELLSTARSNHQNEHILLYDVVF
jgi:hypothetical protein